MCSELEKDEETLRQELIDKLRTEYPVEEDVSFNEFNIQEKLRNHAFLLVRYGDLQEKASYEYEKLKELKEKIVGKRYHHYRFNYDEELTKVEIEKYYLPKDEEVLKINKLLRLQKLKVEFFTICYKAVDKMGWNMKNFIDTHKVSL